jgi:hypothetical protein
MVSALLYYLPNSKEYKIVFMKRKMDEMLASQNTMLRRQGRNDAVVSDEEMAKKLDKHLSEAEAWNRRCTDKRPGTYRTFNA